MYPNVYLSSIEKHFLPTSQQQQQFFFLSDPLRILMLQGDTNNFPNTALSKFIIFFWILFFSFAQSTFFQNYVILSKVNMEWPKPNLSWPLTTLSFIS